MISGRAPLARLLRGVAILIGLLGVLGHASVARAQAADETTKPSYRIIVDRIEHAPSVLGGSRLTVFLTALTLQGQRLDLSEAKSIKTMLGSSELKAPFALGAFHGTGAPMAIVVVVQATLDYSETLPIIAETIDSALLAHLDEKALFAVLPYGEQVGTGKLAPLKQARVKVKELAPDGYAGEPALVETIERAMILLKKAKSPAEGQPLRKMIIVIGDGRDRAGDKDRVTRLGVRAAKEGVRIHTLAYSSTDQRRPLLLLGELSRKSFGTFRWLQLARADSWIAKFTQLLEEIDRQYVITYFLGVDDDPAGKKLKIATQGRTAAESLNELKVPPATCRNEPCAGYCTGTVCAEPQERGGRGVLGWILLVGGIAVGAIVLLGLIGFAMSRRAPAVVLPPGVPPPPGAVPKPKKGKAPRVSSVPPPGSVPPVAPAAAVPHLMFLSGPRAGERVALFHGFSVGKAPNCTLVIEDGYTSGFHAQFSVDHFGNCRIFDQQSTNGSFVNGVRITDYALENGVTVRIGATDLRFLAQ